MPEYSPDDLERRETEAFVDPGSALPDVLGCVGMGATSADSPANDVPHLWPLGEEDGDEPEAVDVDNDPEQIPLDSAEPADMLHSQSSESSDARCCVRNIVKEMRSLERGGQFSHTMIQKEAVRTERRGNVFFFRLPSSKLYCGSQDAYDDIRAESVHMGRLQGPTRGHTYPVGPAKRVQALSAMLFHHSAILGQH